MLLKFIESIVIGVSIAAIPGPIFFELLRRTLVKGFKDGLLLVLGEFSGNFILLSLIFFGISHIFTNNLVKMVLYFIGSLILAWISLGAFKVKPENIKTSYEDNSIETKRNSYFAGLVIAITSPIVIGLWISLSGSFLSELHNNIEAVFCILFITLGFLVFFVPLATIVHKTRHLIPPKSVVLLLKIFGIVLAVYAAYFTVQAIKLI